MRKIFTLLTIGLALSGMSQTIDKISPAGRILINEYRLKSNHDKNSGFDFNTNSTQQIPVMSALVILTPEGSVEKLEENGFEVTADLGTIAVINLPIDKADRLASFPWVKSISFGEKLQLDMNYARPASNATTVQTGFNYNGATVAYDGSGVICGMMDTGLDANHINFKNDDGSSRIMRLWHMNSSDGSAVEYTDATISRFSTDNSSESHATHVAGIIGGGYKGNGTYRYVSTATGSTNAEMIDQPIPYYGVATGADFAFAVGELYTPNIIQGVTNIMNYAQSVGKPVVVNLSLGHTSGPHDGTDAYSRALTELGKRGIICMSAGNDGDVNMSMTQAFTSRLLSLKTTLKDNQGNGVADIWASNSQPLTVTWGIFSTETMEMTELIKITESGQSGSTSGKTAFTNYFNGTITVQSTIDPNNNRFHVYTQILNVSPKSTTTNQFVAVVIEGTAGQTVYLYGDTNLAFAKNDIAGYSEGNAKNSINDGCCADNILSVGSYNSRTTWGQFNSNYNYSYNGHTSVGQISPFSSYGTSFQGTQLPLITGPGSAIISSYSTYYVNAKNSSSSMTATATSGSNTYYWGVMQGTSMSCPYVTGTIGLWLQADPTLTYDRIIDVINNSSLSDANTKRNTERWGAGKIDALAGIQYVLANRAAIGQVWEDDNQRLIVTPTGSGYDVFVADGGAVTATLYDLQGRPVAKAAGADGSVSVDAPQTGHGVYILEVRGADYRLTRKLTR